MDREQTDVLTLLERRATVQEWLLRLEEQRGQVSERVIERVRADYEERLRLTLESLAAHERDIADQLERSTADLEAAEEAHRVALEELEEGQLRNRIGEIDDDSWLARESELEEAVETARVREEEVRSESDRLRELLDQLEGREDTPAPVFALDLQEEGISVEIVDTSPRAPDPAATRAPTEPSPFQAPMAPAENEAFLDEIDEALTRGTDSHVDNDLSSPDQPAEDTAPKPGLKCSECGYTNDLSAWFCGVCGADVG